MQDEKSRSEPRNPVQRGVALHVPDANKVTTDCPLIAGLDLHAELEAIQGPVFADDNDAINADIVLGRLEDPSGREQTFEPPLTLPSNRLAFDLPGHLNAAPHFVTPGVCLL